MDRSGGLGATLAVLGPRRRLPAAKLRGCAGFVVVAARAAPARGLDGREP